MTEKLCIKCKHHYNPYGIHWCNRPIPLNASLITGKDEFRPKYNLCEIERMEKEYEDTCGPEGKYFEPYKSFWEGLSEWITKSL